MYQQIFWRLKSPNHVQLAEECVGYTEKYILVFKCLQLKEGRKPIQDEASSDGPTITIKNKHSVNSPILDERKVTKEEISKERGISVDTGDKCV